ncbi:hypothetical protein BVY04_03065 [bacterium M21]|nr:hypothetical protein BVY04_03065 [bacterium M21]
MALYAFDGTWNEDQIDDHKETNVRKFLSAYDGATFEDNYIAGVGTRFGPLGKLLGGIFGAGGKTRVEEMYEKLIANWKKGDKTIDIIGFSRGSALAIHFSNLIASHGVQYDGVHDTPDIRFLGVWDVVGSFGMPINVVFNFQEINIGYDISSVSDKVLNCFHAMSIHERRQTFDVTRLDAGNTKNNITEVWFRGVHSDVGGGNGNTKLSNITLAWMLEAALDCGLLIDQAKIDLYRNDIDATAALFDNFDPIENEMRPIYPGDHIHQSAKVLPLEIGQSRTVTIGSGEKYSWTGVSMQKGAYYSFLIDDDQNWKDADIVCGPEGWESEQLPWYKEGIVKVMESRRRYPEANWFEIIGSVNDDGSELFRIGKGGEHATYQPKADGDFYAFANDLKSMYSNNHGEIRMTIRRGSNPGDMELS